MFRFVLIGASFGFVLTRVGATDAAAIRAMFLLEDLHLAGVMALAIGLLAIGYRAFARGWLAVRGKQSPNLAAKPMRRGLVLGALLFGVGWGLSGTCPGTALAQIGGGSLAGGVTLLGMFAGVRLESWLAARRVAEPAVSTIATPA